MTEYCSERTRTECPKERPTSDLACCAVSPFAPDTTDILHAADCGVGKPCVLRSQSKLVEISRLDLVSSGPVRLLEN
jgi:hypothetical protein